MKRIIFMLLLGMTAFSASCISTPSGTEDCFTIEAARCEMRGRCLVSFDVEGCKYYYEEQCRAREFAAAYTEEQLDECVSSIDAVNIVGSASGECQMLADAIYESELCMADAAGTLYFPTCAAIACPEIAATDTSEAETTDVDTETDLSNGLNP